LPAVECVDTYGVNPLGHMVIERDRMMSILTSRERPDNDSTALFETMIAYSGSCRIEDGDKLIIKVDTAWHPAWIRTEQIRFFKVGSGVLSITTAWQTHPLFPGRMAENVMSSARGIDIVFVAASRTPPNVPKAPLKTHS
jgi:hypothetical protein